jgi:hypothetical protein
MLTKQFRELNRQAQVIENHKKIKVMNTYREQEVKRILSEEGKITITVVGFNDMTFDETYDNFVEANNAINHYEQTSTVYF